MPAINGTFIHRPMNQTLSEALASIACRRAACSFSAAVLLAAPLLSAAQADADDPPPLRYRVVNDLDAQALADIRDRAQGIVQVCRGTMHLPEAPPPSLPDALLRKIVYSETEYLYRVDRAAQISTTRKIVADEASHCEPFVWAKRDALASIGCETVLSGHSADIMDVAPFATLSSPEARSRAKQGGCHVGRPYELAGLPQANAGQNVSCVWASSMLAPHAKGPGPKADACLYARRPSYSSARLSGVPPVFVMSHKERVPGSSFVDYLRSNSHLAEFREGAAISDDDISLTAIKNFVNRPAREPLPKE